MNFHQWKRREVISLLSGAGAAWPFAVRAQQTPPVPRVGLVSIGADHGDPVVFRPFFEQLRRLGYTEGQGVILDDVLQAAARS